MKVLYAKVWNRPLSAHERDIVERDLFIRYRIDGAEPLTSEERAELDALRAEADREAVRAGKGEG